MKIGIERPNKKGLLSDRCRLRARSPIVGVDYAFLVLEESEGDKVQRRALKAQENNDNTQRKRGPPVYNGRNLAVLFSARGSARANSQHTVDHKIYSTFCDPQ